MKNFQVAIVGGGVVGSAIAWELSTYKIDVVVFEMSSDVASGTKCSGTSKCDGASKCDGNKVAKKCDSASSAVEKCGK